MTSAPSFKPSMSPTTSIPTRAPSITGAVAIIDLSRPVTTDLTVSELNVIQDQIAETYGVNSDAIMVETEYHTTGVIEIDIGDASEEAFLDTLEDELAALLGIHEENIVIVIDPESGSARYTIVSDDVQTAEEIQDLLSLPETANELESAIAEVLPVSVQLQAPIGGITAEVSVVVDTTDAANNLNDAANNVQQEFDAQGYSTSARSKN